LPGTDGCDQQNRDDIIVPLRSRAVRLFPGKLLVQRSVDTLSQSFDFILNQEFAALQFYDTQVVRGKVYKSLVQFSLQKLMFTFQFNEMRLNRHIKPPRCDRTPDVIRANEFT